MTMDNESFKNLLEKIAIINQKYDEMAKISGENFNVFSILNLTTNEVRTHSAFIAELLNPKGKHGLDNAFLKEFVEILKQKLQQTSKEGSPAKFEFAAEEGTKVAVEYWLGYKTETEGGYIDILLTDNINKHIIIENKIYAGDQDKQLLRYYTFDTQAPLIYLTLDGKQPSESSTGKDENVLRNIICISYRNEIIQWLEACHKVAVNHPLLRETIKQYLNLIKILTHQTMETKEREEIIREIAKSESQMTSLQHLFEGNIWHAMRKHQMEELGNSLKSGDWKSKLGEFNFTYWKPIQENEPEKPFGFPEYDFWFYKPGWKYTVYFCFDAEYSQLHYGVFVGDEIKKEDVPQSIKNNFAEKLNSIARRLEDAQWVWKARFSEFEELSWYNKPTQGLELIIEKVKQITKLSDELMFG